MKKLILVAAASLVAAPAFASSMTIEFKRDSGETNVVTLDSGNFTTPDGGAGTYTYDEAAKKMCFALGDQSPCVTFAESVPAPQVGDSARYTADDGGEGTATVTAMTE